MESIKNYCSKCLSITNHKTLFCKSRGSEQWDDYHWSEHYLIVECLGCENVSFRKEFSDEGTFNGETGDEGIEVSIYPLVLKGKNQLDHESLLPYHIQIAYSESIKALKNNCKLLAAAGFRAVIEAVCTDKDVKGRNIEKKINGLHSNGFLSKTEAVRLHSVRFLGNDSIHEIEVPSEQKLYSALSIIEHLLSNLYIIDKVVSDLDTMIENYSDFESLLIKQIFKLPETEEWQLKKVIGKHIRRITPENLEAFEKQLQLNIQNGHYVDLGLGGIIKGTIKGRIVDIQIYVILKANPKLGMTRFFQLGMTRGAHKHYS